MWYIVGIEQGKELGVISTHKSEHYAKLWLMEYKQAGSKYRKLEIVQADTAEEAVARHGKGDK